MKSRATRSKSCSGARSLVWPGPYSVGRGTKAVCSPHSAAVTRSLLRRHHHHRSRRKPQGLRAAQIDLRLRLVGSRDLCSQNRVPGQTGALGHVHQERDVAVRVRRDDVAALQMDEALDHVRPRVEAVPGAGEIVAVCFGQLT